MPEYLLPDDDDEQQQSEQLAPNALAVLNRSEHAAMVQTANLPANRRKLADFDSKLMAYANHSQPVALSMFYSLARAGKQLIGPSVRFAEIVAPCWKNCAVAARVIGDTAATVTSQGVFIDYEANLRNSIEVPRRITGKDGKRYSDDMIVTTSNAAMSVARRNAVLKGGVPQALWQAAYEAAQLTAVGKAASHAQRVADAIEYLNKIGVTEWQILNAVGVPSIRELETEHLVTLRVLCQEIKRGDKTIEEVFGSSFDKEIDALFAQLKMNQAQQTMLRNSYLGRAEKLVEYLRERLGPAAQGRVVEKPRPAASEPMPDKEKYENAAQPSSAVETKAYSDGTSATGVGPLPDQSPAQQDRATQPAPDDSARDNAPWARSTEPADPSTVTGKALPPFDAPASRPQTTMEPSAKRRGRPTREEMARRQQEQQGTLLPPTEQEARQEAERMVESGDQFAF